MAHENQWTPAEIDVPRVGPSATAVAADNPLALPEVGPSLAPALSTSADGAEAAWRRRRSRLPAGLRQLLTNRKAATGLVILLFYTVVALGAPVLVRTDPARRSGGPTEAPSLQHPLGTTRRGQDVVDQLIWGTRSTLGVGVAAGGVATILAILFGLTAAYFGGFVDDVLSLFINVVLIIPPLPLVIVLASFLERPGSLTIALVLGLTAWPWGARVLRSQMLTVRHRDFVAAAQIIGEPAWRIILVEILPNMTSLALSGFIGAALYSVIAMVGLEFIGLGNANSITWGTMLFWAQNNSALLTGAWWTFIPPGLAVASLGFAFALMNFAIDEVTNPRLRVDKVRKVRKEATA